MLIVAALALALPTGGDVPLLEFKGDAYLAPASTGPIRGGLPYIAEFNGFKSVQVNVDAFGNNISGDAANEPSLVMGNGGRKTMAIGWRQFDNVASNFRQAGNGFTTNGGASWGKNPVFTPGTF